MQSAINVAPISAANSNDKMLAQFMNLVDDFDYDNPPPPHMFTVAGIIPAGKVTLFAGEGAAGKTQTIIDLCQKVAYPVIQNGLIIDTWLGAAIQETGSIIYASAEETREDFHSRFADLGCGDRKGDSGHNIYILDKAVMAAQPFFTLNGDNVVSSDSLHTLREMARQLRPKLIVIDTLNSLCPVNIDSNTSHGQAVMQRLGVIAAESGAAIIVTHHITKSGDITNRQSARKAVKGTTGVVDGARNVIVIWQAAERKAKGAVEAGIVIDESHLFCAAVVKENTKGTDNRERFFTKDMTCGGTMREVTNMPADKAPEPKKRASRGRKQAAASA